jgi:hypothetical protein
LAQPVGHLPLPDAIRPVFEAWLLGQLANLLYQVYLFPSVTPPGFAVRRGCSRQEATFTKGLHRKYVALLLKNGWLIKDPTAILYLPDDLSNLFDELAKSIHH